MHSTRTPWRIGTVMIVGVLALGCEGESVNNPTAPSPATPPPAPTPTPAATTDDSPTSPSPADSDTAAPATPTPPAPAADAPVIDPPEMDPPPTDPSADAAAPAAGERWTGEGISWQVPAGWTQGAGGPMRFATLTVGVGASKLEVPVTKFPGDVGGTLANINRWRGQVQLPPIGEADLAKNTAKVKAGEAEIITADMTGPGDQRMLAAIVPDGRQTWFVKLMGPQDQVGAGKAAFDQFVKSIRVGDAAK